MLEQILNKYKIIQIIPKVPNATHIIGKNYTLLNNHNTEIDENCRNHKNSLNITINAHS